MTAAAPFFLGKKKTAIKAVFSFGLFRTLKSGFLDFAGADALNANFPTDNAAVLDDTDILDIGFKCTRGNFHHVHTDPAFFLGKTSTDDGCALGFLLSANFTDVAH